MKFNELRLQEHLEIDSEDGVMRFAGERALLVNAEAMSELRRDLVESFGDDAIRPLLTQFGFTQGWRLAEQMKEQFQWTTNDDWRRAGSHMGWLKGLLPSGEGIEKALLAGGSVLTTSFEAQQQLVHSGVSAHSECWAVSGFIGGYLSRTEEEDILVLEDQCVAHGDDVCRFLARPRKVWEVESSDLDPDQAKTLLSHINKTPNPLKTKRRRRSEAPVPSHRAERSRPGMVTESPAMRDVVGLAERVAEMNSTVVITGESGTGKERIARYIHSHSSRANQPFVAINCGAINENLLESELFGHARGAFTGAVQARAGIFESANHGTLLLDEIGEISPGMQVKLLRVLQEREIQRVGESQTRPIDVRLLAATNGDLAFQTQLGTFREDLYYRIHVIEVRVPPLRERREDILPLARDLVEQSANRLKRQIEGFSPAVADQLVRHNWPGNVRELENAIERAVAFAQGNRIEIEDLPPQVLKEQSPSEAKLESVRPLQDISKEYILAALDLNDGNQTHTANQLKIGTATLYRKLKSYGYQAADLKPDDAELTMTAFDPT